jgi:hypothetical protein
MNGCGIFSEARPPLVQRPRLRGLPNPSRTAPAIPAQRFLSTRLNSYAAPVLERQEVIARSPGQRSAFWSASAPVTGRNVA